MNQRSGTGVPADWCLSKISKGSSAMGDVREPIRESCRRFASAAFMLVAAVALPLTPGCKKADAAKNQAAGPQAVPVDVAVARTDSVQRTVEVVGTLFGEEDATIS